MNAAIRVLCILAFSFVLGACSGVDPWQRGRLAEYGMRPDRDPLSDSMSEHVYFSREAASGGRSIGGGGCGCN
jgi:hypothetical protein